MCILCQIYYFLSFTPVILKGGQIHDSCQGCVKGIRKVCQLMERCDGNWRMEGGVGRCDNCQEV